MNEVSEPRTFEAISPKLLGLRECSFPMKAVSMYCASVPWLVKTLK